MGTQSNGDTVKPYAIFTIFYSGALDLEDQDEFGLQFEER